MKSLKKIDQLAPVNKEYEDLTKWFVKDRQKLIQYLIDEHFMSETQAKELIEDDKKWSAFLKLQKRTLDAHKIKLLKKAQEQVSEALNKQRLGLAAEGSKVIGILSDKTFGTPHQPAYGLNLMAGGERVNIRINFPFKPYKPKEPISELKGEEEVIESEVEDEK